MNIDIYKLTALTKEYCELASCNTNDTSVLFEKSSIESQYAAYMALCNHSNVLGTAKLFDKWHDTFGVAKSDDLSEPMDSFCYEHDLIAVTLTRKEIQYDRLNKVCLLGNGLKYGYRTYAVEGPEIIDPYTGQRGHETTMALYYHYPVIKNGVVRYAYEEGMPGAYLMCEYVKAQDPLCIKAMVELGLVPHITDVVKCLWDGNFNTRFKELYNRAGIVRLYSGLQDNHLSVEESVKLSTLMDSLKLPVEYVDSLKQTQELTCEVLPNLDPEMSV